MNNKKISEFNILTLTPKQLVKYEYRNDRLVNLLVPRFKIHFFQKLIPKKISPYIKIELDELGTATWELIDEKRTAANIADLLKEKFNKKIEQVYERVGLFLQQLNKNKFITFIDIMEK